jgi:uncharacterized protein DUF1877
MGISMSVYRVTDAQIRDFSEDVSRVADFLDRAGRGECYLADFWDGVHFLLTGGPDAGELPLSALKVGDVEFRGGYEPTHAIFRPMAQSFAAELQGLSEAALRERFDPREMAEARVYPIRPWLFPEHAESTFRELMFYFGRLHNAAAEASVKGHGLLFSRYEDL